MLTRHFFDRIDLGYPVGAWHPVDVDDDGTWELAVNVSEPAPARVGIYDPGERRWIDGPRHLCDSRRAWNALDYDDDGDLEYIYLDGDSVHLFEPETGNDNLLSIIPLIPGSAVIWGKSSSGEPLIAISHPIETRRTLVDPWWGETTWSKRWWTIELYSAETGRSQSYTGLPGGPSKWQYVYGYPDRTSTALVVHWGVHEYDDTPMTGYIYLQDGIRLIDETWDTHILAGPPAYRDFSGPKDYRTMPAFALASPAHESSPVFFANFLSYGIVPSMALGGSVGNTSSNWRTTRGLICSSVAAFALEDDVTRWILPLENNRGWERRELETGAVVDTMFGLPTVQIQSGALFEAGYPDLFFLTGSTLYVTRPGAAPLSAAIETPQTAWQDLTLTAAPNPFNAAVLLNWSATESPQALEIYNILGQRVRVFDLAGDSRSGSLSWNGADQTGRPLASGVYPARLVGAYESSIVKLVLLK